MTSSTWKFWLSALVLGIAMLSTTPTTQAGGTTLVFVNGYELTPQELYSVQVQTGTRIPPGNYIVDGRTGCWAELDSGQSQCPGYASGGAYISRYGSGEWNGKGDWNHWSNAAGGAVGGTGDGCIYTTFGWSNC